MQTQIETIADIDIPDFLKASIKQRETDYRRQRTIEETRTAHEAYNQAVEKSKKRIPTALFVADSIDNAINYVTNGKNIKKIVPAAILGSSILFYSLFSKNGSVEEAKEKTPVPEQKPEEDNTLENKVDDARNQIQKPEVVRKAVNLTEGEKIVYERFKPHIDTFRYVSKITGRDPLIYASLVGAESDYKSDAVSSASAVGLAQMTDIAFEDVEKVQESLRTELKKQKSKIKFYEVTHSAKNADKLKEAKNKAEYLQEKYGKLKLLVGSHLDRQKYEDNPAYQIQVGAAYFELLIDYFSNLKVVKYGSGYDLEMKGKGSQGFNPVEAAASSYNFGIGATKKLLMKYGSSWNKHKPDETNIHWNRIVDYGQKLESIEQKVANPKLVSLSSMNFDNYKFN